MNTVDSTPQSDIKPAKHRLLVQKCLLALFKVGFTVFLTCGVTLVALQAVGLAIGSTTLTVHTIPGLEETMTITAGITGLIAFALSYVAQWDVSNQD